MSCCFIDVDGFKQVNEREGHLQGNRMLAAVAGALHRTVRISDSVGRYGGDEFVVLLPDTDLAAALALAQRLRTTICTTTTGASEPLDVSIGVAQWRAGTTGDELLDAADTALRGAKQSGGGQVVSAGDVAAGGGRGVTGSALL